MEAGLTFIVRIYRRACGTLTGVVEDVRGQVRTPFSSAEDLWAALVRGGTPGERPDPPDDNDGLP